MAIFAALELHDELVMIQIAVTAVSSFVAIGALVLVYRQFKIHANALMLNAMSIRHQLFVILTDTLSVDSQKTMMLHARDQFDPKVFEERYKDNPRRIQSYLLMKRKYFYLVFSSLVEKTFPVREKSVSDTWIRELVGFYEFHDVHARQGRYYPEFSAHIAGAVGATTPAAWMCGIANDDSHDGQSSIYPPSAFDSF